MVALTVAILVPLMVVYAPEDISLKKVSKKVSKTILLTQPQRKSRIHSTTNASNVRLYV